MFALCCFKNPAFILKFVKLEKDSSTLDRDYEWIEVNSPARLDLAGRLSYALILSHLHFGVHFKGAWSDTPPICYECFGSCVTNVSILVNGEMPIGAKGIKATGL